MWAALLPLLPISSLPQARRVHGSQVEVGCVGCGNGPGWSSKPFYVMTIVMVDGAQSPSRFVRRDGAL